MKRIEKLKTVSIVQFNYIPWKTISDMIAYE